MIIEFDQVRPAPPRVKRDQGVLRRDRRITAMAMTSGRLDFNSSSAGKPAIAVSKPSGPTSQKRWRGQSPPVKKRRVHAGKVRIPAPGGKHLAWPFHRPVDMHEPWQVGTARWDVPAACSGGTARVGLSWRRWCRAVPRLHARGQPSGCPYETRRLCRVTRRGRARSDWNF